MKSPCTICQYTLLVLLLLILFPITNHAAISRNGSPAAACSAERQVGVRTKTNEKQVKRGWFKQIRSQWKSLRLAHKHRLVVEGERPSMLAYIALVLGLGFLVGVLSLFTATTTTLISLLVLGAFLGSTITALIVLFGEGNHKSKATAKAVLIVNGAVVFILLVLLVTALVALSNF